MNKPKTIKGISDLTPDPSNANLGTQRGRGVLDRSVRQRGAGRSILVDKNGVVIAGNKTLEVAEDIGLPIRVIATDGKELIVHQRTDLDLLEDPEARLLAIEDNRAGQLGLAWDYAAVLRVAGESDVSGLWTSDELERQGLKAPPLFEGEGDELVEGGALPDSVMRMVQLYLTVETFPPFAHRVAALQLVLGTDNVTDTVFKAIERAALEWANV